ncbi:Protein DENND6B like [Actinidia chinensis var. chinensis]|uniref:Protein DENND6B like n=1 Tax=Actinidia chinensis var. chinensis TaxID=1590841 RepID=A0A2R6PCR6_ACTCC|nr:Protein DENND6B like [Actinidia chinensis var. chinensis]
MDLPQVGSPAINSSRLPLAPRASSDRISARAEGFSLQNLSLKRFSPSSLLNAVKLRRDGPLCLMTEHKEAIWSTYTATTKPDTSILNRLIDAGMSPRVEESMSVVNNEILRRHFLELTTNFLAPFGPYFRATTPSEGSSPFAESPPLPPFSPDEFLVSLSARGPGKFLSKRVTNLFFLKALRNIPHIVSVGSPAINSSRLPLAPRASSDRISARAEGFSLQNLSLKRFSPSSLLNAVKLRRDGPLCLMTEHKEAIWSTYTATTKPDTSILNRLIDAGMSPRVEESMSVVNNEILRRHFLELTTNFLAPFGPYFRATTPSEGSSPFAESPPLPPFSPDEFLVSLSARGPGKFLSKRMRYNWLDLYRRFLKGQNFIPWFRRRRAVAEHDQQRLWRQARMKANIQHFISKTSELEIVESFNAIERHLLREMQSGKAKSESAAACQKLKGDLKAVFNVLPEDTKQSLLLNPQRAALLQRT